MAVFEPLKSSKLQVLILSICQGWFHVTSESKENSEISTLWFVHCGSQFGDYR